MAFGENGGGTQRKDGQVNIIIPGQYPRSERLVQATRDFDRRRITEEELKQVRKNEAEEFGILQKGFPYISTGMFAWQDLMRPFAEIIKNCQVTGLKRFYETNTFWKVLEFGDDPQIDESKLEGWVRQYFLQGDIYTANSNLVFTLPFIYLFKNYSRNIDLERIADIIDSVAKRLVGYPQKLLCFFEPSFGWQELTDPEKETGRRLLDRIHSYSETPVIISTSFFNIKPYQDFLYSLPIEGLGIDFYANSINEAMNGFPVEWLLLSGVLSTESTRIEEKEKLQEFFTNIGNYIDKSRIYGTTSGPAELLPRTVIDAKISNLKEVLK